MKLEKVKTNHGIMIRGPYQNSTAYIARFFEEYEDLVDWIIANYPTQEKGDGGQEPTYD